MLPGIDMYRFAVAKPMEANTDGQPAREAHAEDAA
jgi:hypothetical protein